MIIAGVIRSFKLLRVIAWLEHLVDEAIDWSPILVTGCGVGRCGEEAIGRTSGRTAIHLTEPGSAVTLSGLWFELVRVEESAR